MDTPQLYRVETAKDGRVTVLRVVGPSGIVTEYDSRKRGDAATLTQLLNDAAKHGAAWEANRHK